MKVTVIYESDTRWDKTRLPGQPTSQGAKSQLSYGCLWATPQQSGKAHQYKAIWNTDFLSFFKIISLYFSNYLYSLHFTCVHILRAYASPRRQEGNPPSTAPNRNYRVGYIGHPPPLPPQETQRNHSPTHSHTQKDLDKISVHDIE